MIINIDPKEYAVRSALLLIVLFIGVFLGACATGPNQQTNAAEVKAEVAAQINPWGEIIGDAVELSHNKVTSSTFKIRDKQTGELHLITIGGTGSGNNSAAASHQIIKSR